MADILKEKRNEQLRQFFLRRGEQKLFIVFLLVGVLSAALALTFS